MKNIIIVIAVFFFAFSITSSHAAIKKKSKFETLELFSKVLHLVESEYYREVDREKLIKGAIKGMMNTLDPHSTFLDEDIFIKMKEETKGEFGGLGIEVTQKDGIIVIMTVIDDTPAFRSGINAGDQIIELNNESLVGLTLEQAVDKMKGKAGTAVTLGIARQNEKKLKQINLIRELIKTKPVQYSLLQNNYLYIKLNQFQKRSYEGIVDAIKRSKFKLRKKGGVEGIILDLRNNPGGLLSEAVSIASIFLKDGVVVSTEGRNQRDKEIKYVKKTGHKELHLPIAVLINGSSASASEIVAGALQDLNRAVIMGTRSFGKGSVQTISKIDKTKGVKLTIAQYMTPKSRKIQAIGIEPDITLYDIDQRIIDENKKAPLFIREKDLRNHLTATIETPQEKKLRLKTEHEERLKRKEAIEKREKIKKVNGKNSVFDIIKMKRPSEDYQVIQAIKYLKSLNVFKKIKSL